jgi:hypothetical protein
MQFLMNKAKTAALIITALLMASVTLMTMQVQPVQAQVTLPPGVIPKNLQSQGSIMLPSGVTPDLTITTIAHVAVSPNPIGVSQPLLINMWLNPPTDYHYFTDYYLTFTKPDGTTDKVGPINSYPADTTAWINYYPSVVGNWTVKFDFLGGYFPAGNYTISSGAMGNSTVSLPQSAYYAPSSDGPYSFTVQSEMVASWPPSPLPTDYWTLPISVMNREWWSTGGYYPATGVVEGIGYEIPLPTYAWPANTNPYMSNYGYTPYVTGPTSGHIVWARQGAIGGLLGGEMGITTASGSAGTPSIILEGRCYQTVTKPILTVVNGTYIYVAQSVWQCYDLRTGYVYWEQTGVPAATFVTNVANVVEVAGGGGAIGMGMGVYIGCISGGQYILYNPWTGGVYCNVSIAPLTSGTFYMQSDWAYFLSVQDLGAALGANRYRLINWTVLNLAAGSAVNFNMRVLNNVTWPFSSLGSVDYQAGIAATTMGVTSPATGQSLSVYVEAASITTGQLLWNETSGFPYYTTYSTSCADHGKFAIHLTDGHIHCYDLYSGKHLWDSETSSWPWGTWFCYSIQSYGGMIIQNQYDGVVAYDWTTGKVDWHFEDPVSCAFETPYYPSNAFFTTSFTIANGIDYAYESEHTPSQPVTRDWKIFAINATDGTAIWSLRATLAPGAVAAGYLTAANSEDGYMYVIGQGTSATAVTASPAVTSSGSSVLIQGTVFDTSLGIQAPTTAPAGSSPPPLKNRVGLQNVPCVSDASMQTQMDYLYMQLPIKGVYGNETMTGVPVILTAIGSDGTVIDLGTTTTNPYYGTFSLAWTPPKENTYTITATFAGDDSYGSSSAATSLAVGPAPAASPTPTPPAAQPVPDYTTALIGIAVAIIAAIAIATIILYRKRP